MVWGADVPFLPLKREAQKLAIHMRSDKMFPHSLAWEYCVTTILLSAKHWKLSCNLLMTNYYVIIHLLLICTILLICGLCVSYLLSLVLEQKFSGAWITSIRLVSLHKKVSLRWAYVPFNLDELVLSELYYIFLKFSLYVL